MKFTACEVKQGDSFLLEVDEKRILVDGGNDINTVLNEKSEKDFFDLIICTHYDKDHVWGILNLLKEGTKFSELWLPYEMSCSKEYLKKESVYTILKELHIASMIVAFMSEHSAGEKEKKKIEDKAKDYFDDKFFDDTRFKRFIQKYLKDLFYEENMQRFSVFCEKLKKGEDLESLLSDVIVNKDVELEDKITCLQYIEEIISNRLHDFRYLQHRLYDCMYWCRHVSDEFISAEDEPIDFCKRHKAYYLYGLKTFTYAASMKHYSESSKTGTIRWFKYTGKYELGNKTCCDTKIINATEENNRVIGTSSLRKYLEMELLAYRKDGNNFNHTSLVALFDEYRFPNVVFSGDSDYKWLNDSAFKLQLKNNSIITAPHHGSVTGVGIYNTKNVIDESGSNDSLYFVRSDSTYTPGWEKRPCNEYLNMKNKYCRLCAGRRVEFNYNKKSNNYTVNVNTCTCWKS